MVLGLCFKKNYDFINLFFKLNIYVLSKMIYHHFLKNLLKIEFFFLLLFGGIVVKMDDFHLFKMVFF
jgi:hypothetical protein